MRMISEDFENTATGEKVTGITIMIDGKLKQVMDILVMKTKKSYLEIMQEFVIDGIDNCIKKLNNEKNQS